MQSDEKNLHQKVKKKSVKQHAYKCISKASPDAKRTRARENKYSMAEAECLNRGSNQHPDWFMCV